tara:strand:+ start:54 stop:758 length:705 start_codon:yes stop_codon:yes gene_type:complete
MNEAEIRKSIVYNVVHGSRAYGTNIPGSDADEKGIAIIPWRSHYFGFDKFEQKDGEWEDKNDRVIYDIRKFFRLALTCNPNIVEVLYVDEPQILEINAAGRQIRAMRAMFLSRSAAKTFTGYACAQMKRLKNKVAAGGEIRWKHAMHLLRLLRMGKEIVKDGDVLVRRPDAEYLIKVRMGEISLKEIFEESDQLLAEIDSWVSKSPLPEKPDNVRAEKIMVQLIMDSMYEWGQI